MRHTKLILIALAVAASLTVALPSSADYVTGTELLALPEKGSHSELVPEAEPRDAFMQAAAIPSAGPVSRGGVLVEEKAELFFLLPFVAKAVGAAVKLAKVCKLVGHASRIVKVARGIKKVANAAKKVKNVIKKVDKAKEKFENIKSKFTTNQELEQEMPGLEQDTRELVESEDAMCTTEMLEEDKKDTEIDVAKWCNEKDNMTEDNMTEEDIQRYWYAPIEGAGDHQESEPDFPQWYEESAAGNEETPAEDPAAAAARAAKEECEKRKKANLPKFLQHLQEC